MTDTDKLGTALASLDYRTREAIRLLNSFTGIRTKDSCGGHVQETRSLGGSCGDGCEDCGGYLAVRYIPGLQMIDGKFILDGKEVSEDDLTKGSAKCYKVIVPKPFEAINHDKHSWLGFTGSHIIFSKVDRRNETAKTLMQKLLDAYREFESTTGIKLEHKKTKYGFYLPFISFTSQECARLGEDPKAYWEKAIAELLPRQQAADGLWKRIEDVCNSVRNGG